jgi:FkbM family methyltransferase
MNTAMVQTAAHSLGTLRLGRHALPGQGRLVDALVKIAGRMSGDQAVVYPWPGVRFETDLKDRIQRQMWAGTYEPHVRACLDALLQPGDVYVDVGGHIGYHSVAAAHKVGRDGRVYAFEADPFVYERLARNLGQFPWAKATHAAVWDRSGTLTFGRSPVAQESGWGALSKVRNFENGEHVEIGALSLDDWARDENIVRWNGMKLDAEGSELAVLRGAQNILERFQPFMVIEINGVLLEQAGFSSKQVSDFLEERDYRVLQLSPGRLETWDAAMHGRFSDTLCLPRATETAALRRLEGAGFEVRI